MKTKSNKHKDLNTISLDFSASSRATISTMAKNLDTTPEDVITEALALLKIAQGRKLVFKEPKKLTGFELKRYSKLPKLSSR